jgi:predicted DNA binding protein/putative methionine-R-sulfoxide reductase with GAF domain
MPESTVAATDVLAVLTGDPGTPFTAPEVAEHVDCARRTAHKKLTALAEEGTVETKKVGARGRVWWHPEAATTDADSRERSHEQALRELHDASRRLMGAETHKAVADVAVDAAQRILGLSLCGLWLYAPDRDVLDPVAWTEEGVEQYGEPPAFPVEGSLVGQVFAEGSYRVYDDIRSAEEVYDPETSVRSELVLPLGSYGVLNASSPRVGAFDGVDVSLGRVLAANVETALERADRLAVRRARRRELERRRDELETLNRINVLVEETIGSLVGAATREEIERTVCDTLAASDLYVDAWVVERDSPDRVVRRTGATRPDMSDSPAETTDALSGLTPAVAAIDRGVPQVVPRLATDDRLSEEVQSVARRLDAAACLVAPLAYADTVFGALVVFSPTPDGFSDRETTAFETLGRVVGFIINATNNRRLLLGSTAVELRVALDESNAWFVDASERLAGTVAVEGLVPTGDDAFTEYVTVDGVASETAADTLSSLPGVTDAATLATDDDQWFGECTVRRTNAGLGAIVEYGATVRAAEATAGSGSMTVRFPASTAPREAMTVTREAFPAAELVAKRVVDVSDRSVTTVRQAVDDRLTDKQAAAIRAAFLAGYFDSPRGTTSRELAASLDIAPSTLYQHLQAAHRKLLATVFDDLSQ